MQASIRARNPIRSVFLAATFAALVVGTANAAPASSGAEPVDPIDAALTKCLDSDDGQSTAGMVECFDSAYAAWDKELNATYATLSASLDPKSRGLLKRSQRQWIAFRDAERQFWRAPWSADRGTLIQITLGQANVDLVKDRVLALRIYTGP